MKNVFDFSLKGIRSEVDDEELGFRLSGDKIKPVHFATGFFRGIVGGYADTDLLSRFVYVVNAKGQVKRGCEINGLMEELRSQNAIDDKVGQPDVQALRVMMQQLLNADSAVFGERGSSVSYSAASVPFVTGKARYEEVGEVGAEIVKDSCPELSDCVEKLLYDLNDEISMLFNPVLRDTMPLNEAVGNLPTWTTGARRNASWKSFVSSVRRSGMRLCENMAGRPKLIAIRMIVQFAIFHLIRFLAKQESFRDPEADVLPLLAVYSSARRSSFVDSSRSSFLQIGQSLSRFYAAMYSSKLVGHGLTLRSLMETDKAPVYDEKRALTNADKKKAEHNNELWKSAKDMAKLEEGEDSAMLRLGQAIHDMVATASDASPMKYIRGLGARTGILYPMTACDKPYFRFSQDITSMLVCSTVAKGENLSGDEFLSRLKDDFDIITGACDGDYDFCSSRLRAMRADEDEFAKNGAAFVEQICDMGYGKVLADGIFRVFMGE